jgi:hypothetical protein
MPYGADSKRIVLTVASGARVRPAFPASGRRQRLNPFRRRFARRFRSDQLPPALNGFRQAPVAKPVQPGNTTGPRLVDRRRPVADRTFGIGPQSREKRLVVAIALSPPTTEIRIIAIGARLAMAVGLAYAANSSLGPGLRWRVAADHASDELQNVGVASSDDESRGERGRAITQSSGESIREDHEPGCLCSPGTASGRPQAARGIG